MRSFWTSRETSACRSTWLKRGSGSGLREPGGGRDEPGGEGESGT